MKTQRNLTAAFVRKDFSKVGKRTEIYDTVVTGFILRITKTGYKSYAYRYWYNGKSCQLTIGKVGDISLAKARDIARDYKQTLRKGKDPATVRKENRAARPKTFLEVIAEYKEKHFVKLKQSTQDDYRRRLTYFINDFGKQKLKRPMKNFKRNDLLNWLEDKATTAPTNAQRLQALLSGVFSFAKGRGYIEGNIVSGISFREQRKKAPTKQENVAFDEDQIRRLWSEFDRYDGIAGYLFKLLLILGQRAGETRIMKWRDIDFDRQLWQIKSTDTKKERPHEVPLPAMATDILNHLEAKAENSMYVFKSPTQLNNPIIHPSKAAQRIRQRSGVDDFNIHSLRTTFVTWQAKMGTPKNITSKLVNHGKDMQGSVITEIYDKYDYIPEKRKALNRWSYKLQQIIEGKETKIHRIG